MALFDFLDSRRIRRELTADALEEQLQKFRDDIGLSELELHDKAFNDHASSRVHNYSGFKLQIGADKENTFDKILKGNEPEKDQRNALKKCFETVFKKQDFYDKAKESYNASIATFKEIITRVPNPYSVEDIRGELNQIQTSARNAVAAQQKIELEQFKEEIEKQTDNLKVVLNSDDEEIKTVKTNLIKELENSHKTQLAAFDKATAENITLLDKAANSQMEQFIFAAQIDKFALGQSDARKRDEMFRLIDEARAKRLKDAPQGNTTLDVNINPKGMSISALDPKDLAFFYTLTGKKIEQKKPGVWSIEFSPRIFDPGYYLSYPVNQERPKADLLALAQTIRAAGYDGIKMTVSFPNDPYTEKLRLKQAYEACLEAGFPPIEYDKDGKPKKPQHIVLVDSSGKEIDIRNLYKDDGSTLSIIHEQSIQQRKKLDEIKKAVPSTKKSSSEKIIELKEIMRDAKNKGRAEEDKFTAEKEKKLEESVDTVLNKKGPG